MTVTYGKTQLGQLLYDLAFAKLTPKWLARKYQMPIERIRVLRKIVEQRTEELRSDDMADVVTRLRDRRGVYLLAGRGHVEMNDPLCDDAANEIERLRAALERIANHAPIASDFPHDTEGFQNFARGVLDETNN